MIINKYSSLQALRGYILVMSKHKKTPFNKMNIPPEIQEAIKNNRLVVFAGSGLSSKFKLPSWRKLTEDVISDINEKKYNDLLPLLESGLLTPIEVLDKIQTEHTKVRSFIKKTLK
ncbi:MAG: hypothetical protein V4698_03535 [Bacteroidota bacterium]